MKRMLAALCAILCLASIATAQTHIKAGTVDATTVNATTVNSTTVNGAALNSTVPGVFTNTQNNLNSQFLVNGFNPLAAFQNYAQGGNGSAFTSDVLTCGQAVPVGATVLQSNCISAYVTNASPNTFAVGLYSVCAATGNGAHCWGINPLVYCAPGITGCVLHGGEFDHNVNNVTDTVYGVNVLGFWTAHPATSIAYPCARPLGSGAGNGWDSCFNAITGASQTALFSQPVSSSNNSAAQAVTFEGVDGGGIPHLSKIFGNAIGDMVVTPETGRTLAWTDPSFGSQQSNGAAACETSYGITTLNTGATTTNTGLNCLPGNAVIDAVVYRITTTITTAANFTIGDGSTAARFCTTQSTLTAGTTGICFAQSGTSGQQQAAAAAVRVTTNVNPGAGAIRLIVYFHTWTPPTS